MLSGRGVFDGSEIHETVLSLLALSKHGLAYEIVAPNKTQYHVINHLTGDEVTQTRNVLQESARLARGEIKDLQEVRVEDYQALIVPGGFGAAKNLCDFAIKQSSEFTVSPEINQFIKAFKTANKPVAMMCISPVIAAAIYGKDAKVTIGNDKVTAAVIEEKGVKHCINSIVNTISSDNYLKDIVITGGDPFTATQKLHYLINEIIDKAKNIKFIRIGTRLPMQEPKLFDNSNYDLMSKLNSNVNFEVACQINHPFELQPESINILSRLQESGASVYSQNVLLKGVNDTIEVMLELYDQLRYLGVQPHYLFHAVPLKGSAKFRTSVAKGMEIIHELSSSGLLSGRAKPQYALITDVGKVSLWEGAILGKEGEYLNIKTAYKISDRLEWNEAYSKPETVFEHNGRLCVRYLDGTDN